MNFEQIWETLTNHICGGAYPPVNKGLAVCGVFLLVLALFPVRLSAHDGVDHFPKRLFTSRWYQQLADYNGDDARWMTLTVHRHFDSAESQSRWAQPITNALSSWTNSPTTVAFDEHNERWNDDVHIMTTRSDSAFHFDTVYLDGGEGVTAVYDQYQRRCTDEFVCRNDQSRPNTYWYAVILLDGNMTNDQAEWAGIVAHEIGHALSLRHEGQADFRPTCGRSNANPYIEKSIMDYDCLTRERRPTAYPWDFCGVNHAYVSWRWRWSGC